MIELIVSIVVIGIAFMSIPLILTETSKNVETSFRQEAVMAGLTQVVNIMSYRWDEQETNESLNGSYAKILDTAYTSSLGCINFADGRRRIGNFKGKARRKCYNTPRWATPPSALGSDSGDLDDIDDLVSGDSVLISSEGNNSEDYKRSYSSTITVSYISDNLDPTTSYAANEINGTINSAPVTNISTSIKMIASTVTSQDGDTIKLVAFSANIGEVSYLSRRVAP